MKIFNIFKKESTLPLIYVHTFATGEKLYTYRPEDFGKISSRYYRSIQEASNYLNNFLLTKNEWESAVFKLKEIIAQSLDEKKGNKAQALLDINSTMDWFIDKMRGSRSANEILLEHMFCMFYLLEDELPTGYSEIHNKRKIELLNADLDKRDFFLTSLMEVCNDLLPMSRKDTLTALINMERWKGARMYFNLQEK